MALPPGIRDEGALRAPLELSAGLTCVFAGLTHVFAGLIHGEQPNLRMIAAK